MADADAIIAANALDMEHGREKGMSKGSSGQAVSGSESHRGDGGRSLSGIRSGRSIREVLGMKNGRTVF